MGRNEWLREYESVTRWIRSFKENSRLTVLDAFRLWMTWLEEDYDGKFKGWSPDQLVEYQQRHPNYEILDAAQEYITEIKSRGLRTSTVKRYYSTIQSFFKHNRAALPDDTFRPRGDEAPVIGTLTREEIRDVILASNPLYRAVFSCMYAGIMGWGELEYWSNNGYESLIEQLDRGDRVLVAWQSGRKLYANEIPFYNLIGGDAVDLLRLYLEEYREPGAGPIFLTQRDGAMNYDTARYYWTGKLMKLGYITQPEDADTSTRYGKNLHEIRDVARTWWKRSRADVNLAEFMMGHASRLDPNQYEKIYRDIAYSKREYRKALPYVNLLTEDPTKVPMEQHEAELDELRQFKEKYGPWDEMLEDPGMREALLDLIEERRKQLEGQKS